MKTYSAIYKMPTPLPASGRQLHCDVLQNELKLRTLTLPAFGAGHGNRSQMPWVSHASQRT